LVDFGEIEGEVGGDVGVILVDAAVEDWRCGRLLHGGVPGAVGGATGDAGAEAAGFEDGPGLRSGG